MAVKGLISYAEAQTGAHEVTVVPDHRGAVLEAIEKLSAPPTGMAKATPSASMTLRALAEEFKAQNQQLAASTLHIWDCRLEMLGRRLDLDQPVANLTTAQLRRARGQMTTDWAASTVNDLIGKVLRPLLALALEMGAITKSPLEGIKPLKRAKPIRLQPTWAEAKKILHEVAPRAPDTELLLRFILYFGVGQAEVKGLRGEHVQAERIEFFRKKTKKPFRVPIFDYAQAFVQSLRDRGMIRTGQPVFVWQNPRRALETACAKLALPAYSPRALRRTFIIQCLEHGVDPRVVADWQGHANAKLILDTYGSFISKEHMLEQARKLK